MTSIPTQSTQTTRTSSRKHQQKTKRILCSVYDYEKEAQRILPKTIYDYLSSGTYNEQTLYENRSSYKSWYLRPRCLLRPISNNVCTKVNGSGTTGGTVYNAVPGVMFYYSYVVAPASSFTIDVKQTNDGDLNKLFKIQNLSQVRLTTDSCGSISFAGSLINNGTGSRYVVTGATPGATYVVSLKYDVKSIQGAVYSGPDRVSTYTFGCFINGSVSAATGTSGSIDAVWGCVDNTPLPGSCTLLSAKDGTIAIEEFSVRAYPNPYNDNFKEWMKNISTVWSQLQNPTLRIFERFAADFEF